MSSNQVVIRTDASLKIGAGHVMRCLTLANNLAEFGWQCSFAVGSEAPNVVPTLGKSQHQVTVIRHDSDLRAKWPSGCDLLIVDHYGLDWRFEKNCSDWAKSIFVIDDLANRQHSCNFLLDQTPGRRVADYSHLVPNGCRMLLGPDYALLRPQFFLSRIENLNRDYRSQKKFQISIGLGATDPNNVSEKVLRALRRIKNKIRIDIALSARAPHINSIKSFLSSMEMEVELHQDKDDMASFFSCSDLAIGAGGSTTWERCCVGLPSIVLITAENQDYVARQLEQYAAAMVLGHADDVSEREICDAVEDMIRNPEKLTEMSQNSYIICDGLGSHRVTQEINTAFSGSKTRIQLRPATMDDAQTILDWQGAPETRKYARDQRVPKRKEHYDWMKKRLNDATCIFSVITCDGTSVGIIRLDYRPKVGSAKKVFEVSIFLDPLRYRQGIALTALELVRDLIPGKAIAAHVHPENKASEQLFSKAGYEREGEWFYSKVGLN